MLHECEYYCPDCDNGFDGPMPRSRRDFLQKLSGGAAAVVGVAATGSLAAGGEKKAKTPKPSEDLVRELFSTFSDEQKKDLVYSWDHGGEQPSRLATHNSPPFGKRLRDHYTKAQQDLVHRTLRSILASDEALERISRNGRWDGSRSFDGCGSVIFGNPTEGPFSWMFAGHHLTLRCDGNSQPGAGFGGPMYYGHSANGYANTNVYLYQTEQVHEVFDALDAKQREQAMENPEQQTDHKRALKFQKPRPGIAVSELSDDQQQLVEKVMRVVLDPFRSEDADEVMQIVKNNGGMKHMQLAFYGDVVDDRQRWSCWRLEGPGFIWNFRVLPHVHTYVNIVKV